MISVQEALNILHENIPIPKRQLIALEDAHNCILSIDVNAPESSPRYTNSAMDGFALRWEDCGEVTKENPVTLKIIGESQAGIPFDKEVITGTAIRISTGAMLPDGANTVVRVEDTEENEDYVTVYSVRALGQDVRHEGEEFKEGELLFHKGDKLGARELALLAAVGLSQVPVFSPPQVTLLVTGTE